MSILNEEVLRKKKCLGGFPKFVLPGKMVKLCVNPNGQIKLRAKQKYEILSATY